MSKAQNKTHRAYRDAKTGQFVDATKGRNSRPGRGDVRVEQLPARGHVHPKTADSIGRINKKHDKALNRLAKK